MKNPVICSLILLLSGIFFAQHASAAEYPGADKSVSADQNNKRSDEKRSDEPELFIECVLNEKKVYERQPVTATVTLFSSTRDVESARMVSEPSFAGNSNAAIRPVLLKENAYRKQIDGKEFICFPLKTLVLTFDEKGTYELAGGRYRIGVEFPVVVNDPFWGRVRSSELKEFDVPVKKCKIKVNSLPNPGKNETFSGSVGRFSLETVLPAGDIFVNEEAVVYILLRGTGSIADSVLPEYRKAFGENIKLKSVSESKDESFENGNLVSELRLECTFIPQQSGELTIGETFFDYFDPDSGKYVRISSKPVGVRVKSSVSKRESLSI